MSRGELEALYLAALSRIARLEAENTALKKRSAELDWQPLTPETEWESA